MSGLEPAAIALGAAVAKTACQMWLGDDRLLPTAGVHAIDLAAQRLTGTREQRRFRRLWDQAAELVADRVEPLLAHEFRAVPEHERLAAVAAAQATFDAAALTEADLFALDLDAGFLDRHLRRQDPDRVRVAGLSVDAGPLYDRLLRASGSRRRRGLSGSASRKRIYGGGQQRTASVATTTPPRASRPTGAVQVFDRCGIPAHTACPATGRSVAGGHPTA